MSFLVIINEFFNQSRTLEVFDACCLVNRLLISTVKLELLSVGGSELLFLSLVCSILSIFSWLAFSWNSFRISPWTFEHKAKSFTVLALLDNCCFEDIWFLINSSWIETDETCSFCSFEEVFDLFGFGPFSCWTWMLRDPDGFLKTYVLRASASAFIFSSALLYWIVFGKLKCSIIDSFLPSSQFNIFFVKSKDNGGVWVLWGTFDRNDLE